jgi:dipeptidyl aminopeptidase/acylaminoacyl peptidase
MRRVRFCGSLRAAVLAATFLCVLLEMPARADKGPPGPLGVETYLTPPKPIADAIAGLRNDNVSLTNISPDGKKFLIPKNDGPPPLARLARPHVHLGEMAFDPVAGRSHDLWVRSVAGFDLFYLVDQRTTPVQVPDHARVSNPVWSPDGAKLAYYVHTEDATHIYIADTDTGFSRRLTNTPVLATLVTTFQWSKDGNRIQTVLMPDDGRRELPKPNAVPAEPKVRVTRGGANPSRTYRFLLESPHDMKLLEHLSTGQLALIDIHDGKVTKVGFPNLIRSVSMAPGEEQFRVATMKKPFSYYVPLTRFGTMEGIWNLEGKSLYTLADRNLRETEPQPAVAKADPTGKAGGRGQGRGGRGRGQTPAGKAAAATKTADPDQPPPDPTTQPRVDPTDPDAPPRGPQQPVDPNAKRDIAWRPDGAGISYLQLEPEKKDSKEPRNDQVLQRLPPYGNDDVKVVYSTPHRIARLQYSEDCQTLFLTQTIDNQRQISAVDLKDPKTPHVIVKAPAAPMGGGRGGAGAAQPATPPADDPPGDDEQQPPAGRGGRGGFGGRGGAVGGPSLMTHSGRGSVIVVRMSSAGEVYLSGTDRPRQGGGVAKPYLERVNVKSGEKTRVFEGKGEMTETIDAVDGDDVKLVFTTRQKRDVVPNSFMTELATGKVTQLTHNIDPAPWVNDLKVQRFQVTRVDGFKFWVKVTTPAKATGKLPALFWIYPREYTDQAAYNAAAGRTAGAGPGAQPNRFTAPGVRSMTLLTLLDYAVVEPDVPIVGPAGRMNDNYIPDLRNSLWAAIDDLDKKGIIDRDRLACGGHSYGAFSTANAMAHTPFFKAGIAGDGNYNRTLTAMTFQTERRQIWDARETYLEMSPVLWANRVNGALLMYHGMDDANVGTNPINAEHMFMALDGLGKPAALYMYPYEGHGPLAKETTLDLWARWVAWLDMYVKNPKKEAPATTAGE